MLSCMDDHVAIFYSLDLLIKEYYKFGSYVRNKILKIVPDKITVVVNADDFEETLSDIIMKLTNANFKFNIEQLTTDEDIYIKEVESEYRMKIKQLTGNMDNNINCVNSVNCLNRVCGRSDVMYSGTLDYLKEVYLDQIAELAEIGVKINIITSYGLFELTILYKKLDDIKFIDFDVDSLYINPNILFDDYSCGDCDGCDGCRERATWENAIKSLIYNDEQVSVIIKNIKMRIAYTTRPLSEIKSASLAELQLANFKIYDSTNEITNGIINEISLIVKQGQVK